MTGLALRPPIEEKVTIDPRPAWRMKGSTARAQWKVPLILTSRTRSRSSSEMSSRSRGVPRDPPAAAIKMSIGPNSAASASTAALTAPPSRTSTTCPAALCPSEWRWATASSTPFTSMIATAAPASAAPKAIAPPRPPAPPVITATRPANFIISPASSTPSKLF